ncbi:MAG: DUF4153 domain-containing protein, partial [Syntrophomonadaceae bacterium]|nr:DUF4153 domain-containing protein [Syntrophomonadaceae bacterium]
MNRLNEAIKRTMRGLVLAVSRFPLTVICLVGAEALIIYMISLNKEPELIIEKLMFTFLFGAFLGVAAQFSCERFERLTKRRVAVYGVAAVLTLGYYLIIAPAPEIRLQVAVRTMVAVFAMFCVALWIPSYRGKADFNAIALTHFKSIFTSILYSGVLSAGCASIIAAIDTLLFSLNEDVYAYMMSFIWVLFATIYYLSLLPHFNSEETSEREYAENMGKYPKFVEILISYIAVPLLAAYTLVLTAYFIKILITMKWPSGQLGTMVLAYSAAGLTIYVLASLLENRFALWYRRIFPKVLIPVVIMQLVSVAIRLNAYGITESRYYVTLFGIFTLVCGILLSFKPASKNGIIALLAAGFAIFSVIPPVDTFTVSRVSQINRLENMLIQEGILNDGIITPKAKVPLNLRLESTSILSYLEEGNYIKYVKWLPADFKTADEMKSTLGFEPAYGDADPNNFFASIDREEPFDINGYDTFVNTSFYSGMSKGDESIFDLEVRGEKYKIIFETESSKDVRVSVKNARGAELVGTGLWDFAKSLSGIGNMPKEELSPSHMTFDVAKNGYKLRILFQHVNINYDNATDPIVEYSVFVLFGAP